MIPQTVSHDLSAQLGGSECKWRIFIVHLDDFRKLSRHIMSVPFQRS